MTTEIPQPLTRRQLRELERSLESGSIPAIPVPAVGSVPPAVVSIGAVDVTPLPEPVAEPQASVAATADPFSSIAAPTPHQVTSRRAVRAEGATRARPALRSAVVPAKPKRSIGKRVAAKAFSGAALLFAGALLVGSSIPANAFYLPVQVDSQLAYASLADSQQIAVSPQALAEANARSDYKVLSYAERLAAEYGATNGNYAPTSGSIRWPFPYSVPTSDGYGPRAAPCGGCSTFHNGLDFLPGAGVPIYAVAAGTVVSSGMDGSLGNKVELDHVIKGQAVQSVYGHMAMNSSPLSIGDKVKVGDFIGLVGSTGVATAPHLHLEIHLAGVPVNPYTWLTANAS